MKHEFDWKVFWEEFPLRCLDMPIDANVRPNYDYYRGMKNLNRYLKFKKSDKVLDVGCGTGEMAKLIARDVKEMVGCDPSNNMLQLAKKEHPNLQFTTAPAHSMPYVSNYYDKVYCIGVFQYIKPMMFIPSVNEILRVLKPGGIALIGDILEDAPIEAGVFTYPKDKWEKWKPEFGKSVFENRLHVILRK